MRNVVDTARLLLPFELQDREELQGLLHDQVTVVMEHDRLLLGS
ncbi:MULTISPECIES: hypothetical protein [Nocardia]|nr:MULTISPECIES: hypothetical protein [Nocardia]